MTTTRPDPGSHLGRPHPFDTDTAVRAGVDGLVTASVTDRWNGLGGTANGGYMLALALNALRREIDHPVPLAVSAFFLRPGVAGPATVDTEVVRAGRRTATGQVCLVQSGKEVVRATATFGDLDGTGVSHTTAAVPDLPPPEFCLDPLAGVGVAGVTLLEQVEYRMPQLPGFVVGSPTGTPEWEFWMRLAGRDADTVALPMLVDAAPPAILDLGETSSNTVELTVHVRARPAPGWLACRASTRHVADGFHDEDFEIFDSTGTLVAQSRQIAILA